MKSSNLSRRQFIRYSAATTAIFGTAPAFLRGQNLNSKLNVACIAVGGKGGSDTAHVAGHGENIYAICDVDKNTLEGAGKKYVGATRYNDYRKLLEEAGGNIDAVTISTPDHHHAIAASMAMKMGKHVYVQKPLTHSVSEARYLRQLAKEKKIVTQMGNQGSAGPGLRRAVEVIQAGIIGKPLELHVWSNRPIWPQGMDRPEGEDPVPDTLDWDIWLGPAPLRPYKKGVYHSPGATGRWRGWKDFGTGALGDMACHTVNMPFRALKLGYPNLVECEEVSDAKPETYAKTSRIRFEFPAREGLPPLKFWWYDGNPRDTDVKPLRPSPDLTQDIIALRTSLPASGCLVIGEKGRLFSGDDYGFAFHFRMNDEKELKAHQTKEADGKVVEHEAIRDIPMSIPRLASSGDEGHKKEWLDAIRANKPNMPFSNFDVAAYLTEIILLGCVAVRVGAGKRLDWDGPNMKAKNADVASLVKRQYRKGWALA
jgi:hypothetical protein